MQSELSPDVVIADALVRTMHQQLRADTAPDRVAAALVNATYAEGYSAAEHFTAVMAMLGPGLYRAGVDVLDWPCYLAEEVYVG